MIDHIESSRLYTNYYSTKLEGLSKVDHTVGSENLWTLTVFNHTAATGSKIIRPLCTPQGGEFTNNE